MTVGDERKHAERPRSRRVLNVLLAFVFFAVVASLLGSRLLLKAGVEFPEWTGIGSEKSYLEGSEFQPTPAFSIESYADGTFQEEMRMWSTQHLPFRNQMLTAHATMERSSIGLANTLFGYPCYPSRYSHDILYFPEYDSFEWTGTRARRALADTSEPFYMLAFDGVYPPGEGPDATEEDLAKRRYSAYDMDQSVVDGADNGMSVMLYGDSFMEGVVDLVSASFEEFEASAALQWQTRNSTHIRDLFEDKSPDVVMFVAHPDSFMTFTERNPGFFFEQPGL